VPIARNRELLATLKSDPDTYRGRPLRTPSRYRDGVGDEGGGNMKRGELRLTLFLWIFLMVVLFPPLVRAGGRKPPPEPKTVEEKIARQFHIEQAIVLGLKDKGYNTEEVIRLLILATATGKTADEIGILKEEGVSWEEITKKFGIEIDTLSQETQKLLSEVGAGEEQEMIGEKEPEVELEIEKELRKKLEIEKTDSDELH